jgi:hypothetical protein
MTGERGEARERTGGSGSSEGIVPARLRDRLREWVDVDAVGADGFWSWLEAVLPLLPPAGGPRREPSPSSSLGDRVRELARELVDCAGDRARLIADCDRYYTDNVGLARRVKALEASLRVADRSERKLAPENDPEVEAMTERYLPHR